MITANDSVAYIIIVSANENISDMRSTITRLVTAN